MPDVINAPQLLADLTRLLKRLEADLRQRIEEFPDLRASLDDEWRAALAAERSAETFWAWTEQVITQAGVHWLLSCVFLRFIEDNQLVDRPWLGGTPESGRLALVRDRHEAYFQAHPLLNDRDYLLAAFREAGTLPGLHTFFDEAHNPVFRLGISGDAAIALRQFWQQINSDTGALIHDFTDPGWATRFLGDLYQDLSEATRKRYALLQTPEFVEDFILERTLTPAVRAFGFREVRMIDPTCGSGHFLLGGFARLVAEWQRAEPGRNPRDVAQRVLDAVAGVDLNPFAVAISRFRLLVAALQVAGVKRLVDAPDFVIQVAIGDSLLHGTRFGLTITQDMLGSDQYADTGLAHAYASEDLTQVQRILGRQYHAVVGNPPYIVVEDAKLNLAYRKRYASCQGQYSLGVPFTERFFDLAVRVRGESAGFVGLITANSFMKREFGPRLVTEVLPCFDLTHVVDTSGAYIPGHGTPTVILFGRSRAPIENRVRAVLGIKGEPSAPAEPAQGKVWRSILEAIDQPGFENRFISTTDYERKKFFQRHPWRIRGGGAAELADWLDERHRARLPRGSVVSGTGRTSADEAFVIPPSLPRRYALEEKAFGVLVEGDMLRDWSLSSGDAVFAPYSDLGLEMIESIPNSARWLWPMRTTLGARVTFGRSTYAKEGRPWWGWHQVTVERLRYRHIISCAFVATHNHFVLDRGGKVFKQTAPAILLPDEATEDQYLGLLGLLNSSAACFWMKQTFFDRGNGGIGGGIAAEEWERFYEHASTPLSAIPLPLELPVGIARKADSLAKSREQLMPSTIAASAQTLTREILDANRFQAEQILGALIGVQEELDWQCYRFYELLPEGASASEFEYAAPPKLRLGERAFEIVLARRVAAGGETTTWFERHGSTPVTDLPDHWPMDYRSVVERRIALIESERNIGLIEQPEYKRRWNIPAWEDLERAALRDWLVGRLEQPNLWTSDSDTPPQLITTTRLADAVRGDADFMQMAGVYSGHADFDIARLVSDLVNAEAVPMLPVQRYSEEGLRKRMQWQDTWNLQRREDAGEITRDIPAPPKYKSSDFLKAAGTDYWRLRGGLDVPKERFISFPGAERGSDGGLLIAWAGWTHLQQATALAGYYMDMKDSEGWEPVRLQPLLASLLELVPWLEQWHNDLDPVFGERMGDYYRGFVSEEARAQGFTLDDLRAWKPTVAAAKRGRKKKVAS